MFSACCCSFCRLLCGMEFNGTYHLVTGLGLSDQEPLFYTCIKSKSSSFSSWVERCPDVSGCKCFGLMMFLYPGVNCEVWIPIISWTDDISPETKLWPWNCTWTLAWCFLQIFTLTTDRLWINQSTAGAGGGFGRKDPQNMVGWSGGLDPLDLEPVCLEPWTSLSNLTWLVICLSSS